MNLSFPFQWIPAKDGMTMRSWSRGVTMSLREKRGSTLLANDAANITLNLDHGGMPSPGMMEEEAFRPHQDAES